jgi:uncharacterized protein YjbI with pentapeptide repeats
LDNDIPQVVIQGRPAQIGDSITVRLGGDRIKVTLLGLIDPAVVDNPGIDTLFDRLGDASSIDELLAESASSDIRYIAVQLKVRNLEPPVSGQNEIVHVQLSGALIDANGEEHPAQMASVEGGPHPVPPHRGEPNSLGSIAFKLPAQALPDSYVLTYSGRRVAAWKLSEPSLRSFEPVARAEIDEADPLQILKRGVDHWNTWRKAHPSADINLSGADLRRMNLEGVNLSGVGLRDARFHGAQLAGADLRNVFGVRALFNSAKMERCDLTGARLAGAGFHGAYAASASFRNADLKRAFLQNVNAISADFSGADLRGVDAIQAGLAYAYFVKSDLRDAKLREAVMIETDLQGANLADADMTGVYLSDANLSAATLHRSSLAAGNLQGVDLRHADVRDSDLSLVSLVGAKLDGTLLSNCQIYGIAAWNIEGQPKLQEELVITRTDEGCLVVNDLEIAQFIYLLLNYKRLQTVFNSMTDRGVLLLGRFGGGGIEILRQIAERLRADQYIPIIFEFERPEGRNLTETVKTLVGLSRFVIVDLSGPSVPQELTATIPHFKIPFVPILQEGSRPYAMFADLLEYPWVLKPIVQFTDLPSLLADLPTKIIARAEERVLERQAMLRELFSRQQ